MRTALGPWAAALALGLATAGAVRAQTIPLPPPMPVVPAPPPPPPPPLPTTVPATQPAVVSQPAATQSAPGQLGKIVVTSYLDRRQQDIAPGLGAKEQTMGQTEIQAVPGGENASGQQVLLRMAGVVEDSFGQVHVRGEHGNLTYRINGVILPEPLNGFGQELDTHLIDSVTLIDGTLPAQFGFRTTGIVDVSAKSGANLAGNEISLYAGSQNTLISSFESGGVAGKWDYFLTGSYRQDNLGIENPTASQTAIHDQTDQSRLFAYLAYAIDATSRVSLLLNASDSNFQIPNAPGQPQAFNLKGVPFFDSRNIDENQNEQAYYDVISYQKSVDRLSLQASTFVSYGQINFSPDPVGDLIFQGVAGNGYNNFVTEGFQLDGSYILNDRHALRAGLIADYTVERLNSNTLVFPTDPMSGTQSSDMPFAIVDNTRNDAANFGVYLQDEWKLTPTLTLNYGARYDCFDANFDHEGQLSPRANLVWKVNDATTAHVGYARYFVPPPVQFVPLATIQKFTNTTNAPPDFLDGSPKVERSNYFDAGITRQITPAWLVNLDGFYKQASNLVDSGQFGQAVILSSFNYRKGYDYGAELSSTYKEGPFSAFGNFAFVETGGKDIDSQQFLINSDDLAYSHTHYIKLDHESNYTASLGASYKLTKEDLLYVDMLYGSGLRSGFANTQKEPEYFPVNCGYEHHFHPDGSHGPVVKLRFDILNVFDESYQLRNGTGIGVGAPQYGQRRAFLMGLAYDF